MGSRAPRRSDSRPASGDRHDSIAAEARKVARDDRRRGAQLIEAQRGEHVHHPKAKAREHRQPQAGRDPAVPQCGPGRAQSLRLRGAGRRHEEGHHNQDGSEHRGAAERGPGAHLTGDGPDQRAEERPDNGGPDGVPQQFAAPLLGRNGRQPGQARGPGARSAQSLDEPRRVQHHRSGCPAKHQGGHAHQRQPQHGHQPVAPAGGEHPTRQRPDQRAERVGGHEESRARLRQASHVHVVRKKRGQRGEEEGVHQHDRAYEAKQRQHRRRQLEPCPPHVRVLPMTARPAPAITASV